MSASRTVTWNITNATSKPWTLSHSELNHGIWSTNPPKEVPPGKQFSFRSESNGLMTGCEGTVTYYSDDGDFLFYFDNPFVGSDDYTVTNPDECDHKTTQITGNDYLLTTRCFELNHK